MASNERPGDSGGALGAGITPAGEGGDGTVWSILGHTYYLKSSCESSFSFETYDPPGTFVPPHVHPTQDEFIYVLEGRFDLFLHGEWKQAGPGDLVKLPRGIAHAYYNRSVLTVGEIRKGIENIRRRDQPAAESLDSWLQELVTTHQDRILQIDQDIAEQWGRFNVPDPLPVLDSLLAATAQEHGLTLVTRNLKDVERTGVPCINPFRWAERSR